MVRCPCLETAEKMTDIIKAARADEDSVISLVLCLVYSCFCLVSTRAVSLAPFGEWIALRFKAKLWSRHASCDMFHESLLTWHLCSSHWCSGHVAVSVVDVSLMDVCLVTVCLVSRPWITCLACQGSQRVCRENQVISCVQSSRKRAMFKATIYMLIMWAVSMW